MSDTPRLLRYTRIANREMLDGELWVAITRGSPGMGGDGVVISGRAAVLLGHRDVVIDPALEPGGTFKFAANKDYDEAGTVGGKAVREVWGLDAVPPTVAAAWMRFKHTGKLNV